MWRHRICEKLTLRRDIKYCYFYRSIDMINMHQRWVHSWVTFLSLTHYLNLFSDNDFTLDQRPFWLYEQTIAFNAQFIRFYLLRVEGSGDFDWRRRPGQIFRKRQRPEPGYLERLAYYGTPISPPPPFQPEGQPCFWLLKSSWQFHLSNRLF